VLNPVASSEVKLNVQKLVELPAISPLVDRMMEAISNEDISIEQFARLVEQDPALLGRVIGLANAAYFGQPEPITTAEDAIFKALGMRLAKSLALSISLAGPFQHFSRVVGFVPKEFWFRAVFTATLVQELCPLVTREPRPHPDEAYLAGMLHDFGLLPLVHLYPEEMARVFALVEQEPEPGFSAAMRRVIGIDHHQVGAWLAGKWRIPPRIVNVILHCSDTRYSGEDFSLVWLVHAAAEWADTYRQDNIRPQLPDSAKVAFFELGISAEQVVNVQQKIHAKREFIDSVANVLTLD
jgi:HD-like signal output (HDOD) protein